MNNILHKIWYEMYFIPRPEIGFIPRHEMYFIPKTLLFITILFMDASVYRVARPRFILTGLKTALSLFYIYITQAREG